MLNMENLKLRNHLSDDEIIERVGKIIENSRKTGVPLDIYDTTPIYTVKQFAEILNTSAHTVRYYDKEHLFPFVIRDDSSNERLFSDADRAYGKMILCLRRLGLSIRDCRIFILDTLEGDKTAEERLHMLTSLQKELVTQMQHLQDVYNDLQYKIRFYSYLESQVSEEMEKDDYENKNRGTLSELKKFISRQKELEQP